MIKTIQLNKEIVSRMTIQSKNECQLELEKCRIKPSDKILEPPVCLTIKNSDGSEAVFGTLGNISTILGKAKSKKTFSLALVVSATLRNDTLFNKLTGKLPDNQKNVLYFDTEQSNYHTQIAIKRICQLAQTMNPVTLFAYGLRSKSPAERLMLIEHAVYNTPQIGLLVIDGIKDLISSINDEEQATYITSKLLKWSEEKNIHIVTILHQNKGNEHARGHIGTELINKSESVYSVSTTKNKQTSVFEAVFCRGKEPEPFAFQINDKGIPELIKDFKPDKAFHDDFSEEKIWQLIQEAFKPTGSALGYKDLTNQLKSVYYLSHGPSTIGDNKAKEIISLSKKYNMIYQEKEKKPYVINKDYSNVSV